MGIYIKGIKMPKSCYECTLNVGEYSIAEYEKRYCAINDQSMCLSDYKRRPSDCPLVELPEKHGRLIDEDNVIDAIHERLHTLQTHKEFIKKRGDIDLLGVLPYIGKIQTVIEAEGE